MAEQHLIDWGLPSFSAGGSCSMGYEDPSYRRKQPLAPISTPTEIRLITGKLLFSVLCLRRSEAGVSSPGRDARASVLESPAVAHAAGFHSPHQRVAPRSSDAGTVESR